MPKPVIYGIKNCETMKKTFQWLDKKKIDYDFHDYKKSGADRDVLARAMQEFGWENVLNRKSTTWRKLPEKTRENMTEAQALKTALENPSVIRRPLTLRGKKMVLGFDEAALSDLLRA